jgi:membrane protease YdiL (CAAX protease family)
MSETTLSPSVPAPAPEMPVREPWKFWASTAWTVLAIGFGVAAQFGAFVLFLAMMDPAADFTDAELDAYASHGLVVALAAIAVVPAELGVVWLAIKLARMRIADYLAIARPRSRDVAVGMLVVLALLPVSDLSAWLLDKPLTPPFVIAAYTTARDFGALVLLAIALVIAAPLAEEVLFRGFMYRGLAASRVGVIGAILIPTLIWTVLHQQYDAFYLFYVFVLGIVFGWLRWRSGTIVAPMIIHGIINAAALAQAAFMVEVMGAR